MVLAENDRPQIWFLETVNELSSEKKGQPSAYRCRLARGHEQFIPTDVEGVYEGGDPDLNIQADRSKRGSSGLLLACDKIGKSQGGRSKNGAEYYFVPKDATIYSLNGPEALEPNHPVQKAFDAWKKTGKIPSRVFKKIKPAEATTIKPKSLLDKLRSERPCPTVEADGFYVNPEHWYQLLINLVTGPNTLLLGHAGTGKTELAALACRGFGEFSQFDMSSKLDPVASLIGTHRHRSDKGGSYFQRAPFTYAIEKPGVILLDEISRDLAFGSNLLFSVLDSRRRLFIDTTEDGVDPIIPVHPECRFIATANQGVGYTGTVATDIALDDRFETIRLEYPDVETEAKIISLRKDTSRKEATIIAKAAAAIRDQAQAGNLSRMLSMRKTLYAGQLCTSGMDVDSAMRRSFLSFFPAQEAEAVADVLTQF